MFFSGLAQGLYFSCHDLVLVVCQSAMPCCTLAVWLNAELCRGIGVRHWHTHTHLEIYFKMLQAHNRLEAPCIEGGSDPDLHLTMQVRFSPQPPLLLWCIAILVGSLCCIAPRKRHSDKTHCTITCSSVHSHFSGGRLGSNVSLSWFNTDTRSAEKYSEGLILDNK